MGRTGGVRDEECAVYRVFEALDELVSIVEEARGVPMTSGCVVPRGDVLELLDEVRDAIPTEMDDAQDVLDQRDELIGKAEHEAEQGVSKARSEAERVLQEARGRAERIVADARTEAERAVAAGRQEYEELVGRAHAEAERMVEAGRGSYERAVDEGRAEQARLVTQTEVVQAARSESTRIIDEAHTEAEKLRGECDAYVDAKLADFEDLLTGTLRTVGKGRSRLRGGGRPAGALTAPFDYQA
jgi:cell division septum initiation protein DivIVA